MQKIRKILGAVSEKTALPTNQPIITTNTDLIGPRWRRSNKLYKTLDYWSRDLLKFNFPEKSLGLVFPPYFMYDFSRKFFLMLYSIKWPNLIVWLPLLLKIFGNMCITIVC